MQCVCFSPTILQCGNMSVSDTLQRVCRVTLKHEGMCVPSDDRKLLPVAHSPGIWPLLRLKSKAPALPLIQFIVERVVETTYSLTETHKSLSGRL